MAAIEQLGPADATTWLVLHGRVWEGDEQRLLERAIAEDGDVTVDLTEVDELTIGGCWALRSLADRMWERGRRLSVLIRPEHPSRELLVRTGTLGHPRIRIEEASG